jgi:Zn-finger nucleic acid-binding protein
MRVSGVMVDFCLQHGVWCDAGELPAMVAFLEAGGAERGAQFERDSREHVRRVRTSVPDDD